MSVARDEIHAKRFFYEIKQRTRKHRRLANTYGRVTCSLFGTISDAVAVQGVRGPGGRGTHVN